MRENKRLNASVLGNFTGVSRIAVVGGKCGPVQVSFALRVLLPDELVVLVRYAVFIDWSGITVREYGDAANEL